MRHKKTMIATAAALSLLTALWILRQTQPVLAQYDVPPPMPNRIAFGLIGITSGLTLRVSVANTVMPNDPNLPPGPIRVVMSFRYMNGNLVRNYKTGEVIRRAVDLERGDGAFLDVDYADLPPGPSRAQIRPVVVVLPPSPIDETQIAIPPDSAVPTVEVINNANGRSQFAVFTHPAVLRGFKPQPDPPSEP
jgi:hypothetical protein